MQRPHKFHFLQQIFKNQTETGSVSFVSQRDLMLLPSSMKFFFLTSFVVVHVFIAVERKSLKAE